MFPDKISRITDRQLVGQRCTLQACDSGLHTLLIRHSYMHLTRCHNFLFPLSESNTWWWGWLSAGLNSFALRTKAAVTSQVGPPDTQECAPLGVFLKAQTGEMVHMHLWRSSSPL